MINFAISPGDVQDRNMIAPLLAIASKRFPSLKKAIADGGYQGKPTADDVKEQAGIPLEIVKRSDAAKGFYVLQKCPSAGSLSAPTVGLTVADGLSKTTRISPAITLRSSFSR